MISDKWPFYIMNSEYLGPKNNELSNFFNE